MLYLWIRLLLAQVKYVQGENTIAAIAAYVKPYGNNPMVIADDFVTELVGETAAHSFIDADMQFSMELFGGECSRQEIDRLQVKIDDDRNDVIIGIGGGGRH